MPVRLLHLITDLDVGGAELMLAQLVRRMDRRRFESSVACLTPLGPIGTELARAGVPVHSLGIRRGLPDPRGVARLLRILREHPVDILQTWLYHADLLGLIAAPLARVPHLLWNLRCAEMDLARYSRLSALLPRLLARFSAKPDAILVNSQAGQRVHERFGYRPKRWEPAPNGFDTDRFRPDPAARGTLRAALGWPDDSFVICLPARFDPMKDHATFIAAAALFARESAAARFVLAGRDVTPSNQALGALIARAGCGERLALLGERRDMPSLLAGSDVVTLSSRGEAFPNVLGEAMACATPVAATEVGDAAAIVGETGILVPPADPAALAAAWRRIEQLGKEGRIRLGAAARQRILDRYALDAVIARYEQIYQEVAAGTTRERDSGGAPAIPPKAVEMRVREEP